MSANRQWSLLTALVVLGVLVVGWFLLVGPKRSEADQLRADAAAARQHNLTLEQQLEILAAQANDLPAEQARLAAIGTKIPDAPVLPSLIRALTDAADSAGVDLASLAPGPPTSLPSTGANATGPATSSGTPAGTGPGTAAASPGSGGVGQLAQIPVTLKIDGGFFEVEQFLSNLEALPRAFLVTGLTIAPGEEASPQGQPATAGVGYGGILTVTLNGQVFMTADSSPTPAGSTAAPRSE